MGRDINVLMCKRLIGYMYNACMLNNQKIYTSIDVAIFHASSAWVFYTLSQKECKSKLHVHVT